MVGPISPPGIEKSVGRIVHFWIFCALDVALLLYLSMPAWMASIMTVSGFLRTSSRVSDFEPCSLHHSMVSCANFDFGSSVSLSIWEDKTWFIVGLTFLIPSYLGLQCDKTRQKLPSVSYEDNVGQTRQFFLNLEGCMLVTLDE